MYFKDERMFFLGSQALTAIMKTNLINDTIYHFHTRKFLSLMDKRHTYLAGFPHQINFLTFFMHPVGPDPNHLMTLGRAVVTHVNHVWMHKYPADSF